MPMPVIAAMGIAVTLSIFLLGVVYQAGKLAARIESLEAWRLEMTRTLDNIHGAIRRVELAVRGDAG